MSIVFVSTFVSCDKDNENGSDNGVSVNTLSAKWEISDNNSPYASFEFNKDGNYIVVENDFETNLRSLSTSSKKSLFKSNISKVVSMRSSQSNLSSIHFGTYKIEGNKIILSGFGLMEVISITNEEFSFSFTLEATGEKNSFVAGKSDEPISSSSRTNMLCRTWYCEKITFTENALELEEIELLEEMAEEMTGMTILLSKAGTYLCLYTNEEAGLAEWKWANEEETQFYFSWENWTEDLDEMSIATINQLNVNSLEVQDYFFIYHLTLKN